MFVINYLCSFSHSPDDTSTHRVFLNSVRKGQQVRFIVLMEEHGQKQAKIHADFIAKHFEKGDEIWGEYSHDMKDPPHSDHVKYLKQKPSKGWVSPQFSQRIDKILKKAVTVTPAFYFNKLKQKKLIPENSEFDSKNAYLRQYVNYKLCQKAPEKAEYLIRLAEETKAKRIFILIGKYRIKPLDRFKDEPGGSELFSAANKLLAYFKSTNSIILMPK